MTLIELMVVIAIVGLLASIAIPNFTKFQARAKQAEAKQSLTGIFSVKLANFAEHQTYICGFCGFSPEKGNRYTYRAGSASVINSFRGGVGGTEVAVPEANVNNAGETRFSFTATAMGNIDSDAFLDGWCIDTQNNLCNGKYTGSACDLGSNDITN